VAARRQGFREGWAGSGAIRISPPAGSPHLAPHRNAPPASHRRAAAGMSRN
jgi:hypothetical protein